MKYQKQDLAYFPYQIEYAVNKYNPHSFDEAHFNNLVICGLGGSGIAGRIVQRYFADKANIPVEVVSDYHLPNYVNDRSLVILSSYSGNTEETLSMYREALNRESTIMVLTTGGKLLELAKENHQEYFLAEPGFQPRMALGYSLTYLLMILGDLFDAPCEDELRDLSVYLRDTEDFLQHAEDLFDHFKSQAENKLVAITDFYTYPMGVRFTQQVQENAKGEAFVHELPEANHNVIESYYSRLDSVFIFLNTHQNERVELRFKFLEELLRKNGNKVVHIPVRDHSLRSMIESIYILDWIALWIADHKNINSMDIPNISTLKKVLSEKESVSGKNMGSLG